MNVFLSWSGLQSKAIAEALRDWIPLVINAAKPWMSSEIEKGRKWSPEISASLEATSIGIICLTRMNLQAPWILFEAGALSKTRDARVSTFLYGLSPADIEQPLGQFQHTVYERADVLKLVRAINQAAIDAGEGGLPDRSLERSFHALWPSLKEQLDQVVAVGDAPTGEVRSDRAILEEVLELLRSQQQRPNEAEMAASVGPARPAPPTPDRLYAFSTKITKSLTLDAIRAIRAQYPHLEAVTVGGEGIVAGVVVVIKGNAARVLRFMEVFRARLPSATVVDIGGTVGATAIGVMLAKPLKAASLVYVIERAAEKSGVLIHNQQFLSDESQEGDDEPPESPPAS